MTTNDVDVLLKIAGTGGATFGHAHANPLFNTREYKVRFADGIHEKYQANVIAENMSAQVG